MTDLVLTSAQQTELYNFAHYFATQAGWTAQDTYFVGTGKTRIQQAVQAQFNDVNAGIDLLIAAVEDTPTNADLAQAVNEIKAHIDAVCGP